MSKNNPLEALEKLRQNNKDNSHLFDDELLDIIETALKELENRRATENVVKTFRESPVKTNKKLKALDFFKNNFIFEFKETRLIDTTFHIIKMTCGKQYLHICVTEEEFKFLKEVL